MNCPFCNEVNDDQNTFCVSCGRTINQNIETQANVLPPTQYFPEESLKTAYPPVQTPIPVNPPPPNHNTQLPIFDTPPPQRSRGLLYATLGIGLLLLIGLGGLIGVLIWQNQPAGSSESLPDHLGMFVQDKDKRLTEIKKLDVSNVIEEKVKILEDENLPVWEKDSSLILYADAKDIPISDLKLVPLESIGDDGTLKQIDFQAAPIGGDPSMKRLRVSDGIAAGRYAFVLFDGYLDDGKHKFWAFQVKDGQREDNEGISRTATLSLKDGPEEKNAEKPVEVAKPAPQPQPREPATREPDAQVVFCNSNNVVLRGSASLQGRKIGRLSNGQRLYVLGYSSHSDEWRGTVGKWVNVQTESGVRGWVFSPFVNY